MRFISFCLGLALTQAMFSCTIKTTGDVIPANHTGHTIETRYGTAPGMVRMPMAEESFARYLRRLPLKPAGAKVHYYNGEVKDRDNVYDAVVDMEIGNKNLQQCADAVIRLRAEFLFAKKMFNRIGFHFTNGFYAAYDKWRQGYRIKVKGNRATWIKSASPSDSYAVFRKYLDIIFSYAGTLSLSREMETVPLADMRPGDVLIQGGSPGHAVIVVDMAQDTTSGKKYFMLAQSYMPAQEIQVLLNPNADERTVWYELDPGAAEIITPEWQFTGNDLKRFPVRR